MYIYSYCCATASWNSFDLVQYLNEVSLSTLLLFSDYYVHML